MDVKFVPSLGPGSRPAQNLSSIYRLFVSRKQNGKLLLLRLLFFLMNSTRVDTSFPTIYFTVSTYGTKLRFVCRQAIPKGRVPVFKIPNSFRGTKGHGTRRRSIVFSRIVRTTFRWFRSPHGIME